MGNISFRYADQSEQLKTVNKLMCVTTTILNVLMYIITIVSFLLGDQTLPFAIVTFIVMAATSIGGFVILAKNRSSGILRYFTMVCL